MMKFNGLVQAARAFVTNNAPAILTGIGVTGTIATALLTARASFGAANLIRDAENEFDAKMTFKQKADMVWPAYIPAVATASLTIVAVVGANRIGARRAAALAAVYSVLEKGFDEYQEKVAEVVGPKKEQAVRDQIAQDKINANPPITGNNIFLTSHGSVICMEDFTGRHFLSDMETIRKAVNDVNERANKQNFVSLSEFYDLIELPHTAQSDDVGWTSDKLLEVGFSATLTPVENKPCMVMTYRVLPKHYRS